MNKQSTDLTDYIVESAAIALLVNNLQKLIDLPLNSMDERIFALQTYADFSKQRATVTEVVVTDNSSIAVWAVKPGQEVAAHLHPSGQDTWVMLKGTLTYYLGNGQRQTISPGECAIADQSQIHGAVNNGTEDAVFVSIYSAPKIGYTKALP